MSTSNSVPTAVAAAGSSASPMGLPRVGECVPGRHEPRAGRRLRRVAVAGDAAVRHLEPDEPARHARGLLRRERLAAEEVALVHLHDPAEVRLERGDGVVDVVAVERHLRLETQRVPRAEAAGRAPSASPRRGGAGRSPRRLRAGSRSRTRPRRCSRCARRAPATRRPSLRGTRSTGGPRDPGPRRARAAPPPSAPARRSGPSGRCGSRRARRRACVRSPRRSPSACSRR